MKLLQEVTYWRKSKLDGFNNYSYGKPKSFLARWQYTNKLFVNDKGEETVANATVYTDLDLNLKIHDILFLGKSIIVNPILGAKTLTIKSIFKLYNLNYTRFIIKIWL